MYVTPKVSVVEHGLSNVCFVRKPSLITDNNYLTKPFVLFVCFFFLLRIILIESKKVEATIPQTEPQDFRFAIEQLQPQNSSFRAGYVCEVIEENRRVIFQSSII